MKVEPEYFFLAIVTFLAVMAVVFTILAFFDLSYDHKSKKKKKKR